MVTPPPGPASRFAELPAGRMHYLDAGQGAPIVCLHGNPTHSYFFRSVLAELAPDHRVIVPDHLGCGQSDLPDEAKYGYRLADRVADVERLLDLAGVKGKLTLVLHDWGGMIGLAFAARHPERIARLVLMNTAGFPLPATKPMPWELRLCRAPLLGAALVRGLNLFCRTAARRCAVKRPLPADVKAAYLAPHASWRRRLAVHRFVQDIPLDESHPSWPMVRTAETGLEKLRTGPRLICWGEKDFIFDSHFLAEWRRRWPDAEYELYPDAGHYLLEDEPEAVPQRIRRFLSEHPLAI